MRICLAFLLAFCITACSILPQNAMSPTSLICETYTKLDSVDFNKTSSETLREWVRSEFPRSQIEDYRQTGFYDYTIEWEDEQIEYFANYREGHIVNIQVHINQNLISPRDVTECLGAPDYYSAVLVGPQLSVGLIYPEKGVNIIGRVRDSITLPDYDDPIIQSIYFARPTPILEEFLTDINPSYSSADSPIGINSWRGWENMEILGITSLENAVLSKLLAGDDKVLEALRLQLAHATMKSRQMTGAGFYLNFSIPAAVESIIAQVPNIKSNFCFGDVAAHIDGLEHGAGFLLWVTDGKVDFLEGYTYEGPWRNPIENFHLQYFSEPRDMDSLRKCWLLDAP